MPHCLVCGEEVEEIATHVEENHTQEEFVEAFGGYLPTEDLVRVSRPNSFRKDYATNFIVEHSEFDFRILVTNERFNHRAGTAGPGRVIEFVAESMVISTPTAAKTLVEKLTLEIAEFEEEFGAIEEDDGQRREMENKE